MDDAEELELPVLLSMLNTGWAEMSPLLGFEAEFFERSGSFGQSLLEQRFQIRGR